MAKKKGKAKPKK